MRAYLKEATQTAHSRLDRLFGTLDLTARADYGHFIAANHRAHGQIADRLANVGSLPFAWPDFIAPLDEDLDRLGLCAPARPAQSPMVSSALGLAYVALGAQFGAAVLRRTWARSTDPLVMQSGAFLSFETPRTCWQPLLSALADADTGPRARDLHRQGALCAFEIFADAFHATTPIREDIHALH